jgi:hypothetical protein
MHLDSTHSICIFQKLIIHNLIAPEQRSFYQLHLLLLQQYYDFLKVGVRQMDQKMLTDFQRYF